MSKKFKKTRPRRKSSVLSSDGVPFISSEQTPLSMDTLEGLFVDEQTGEVEKVPSSETGETIPKQAVKWATNKRIWWAASETDDALPPGLYLPGMTDQTGPFVSKQLIQTDMLLPLPDSPTTRIVDGIKHFWTLKESYTRFGFLHKRGILMYGPAGSGKTATIQQLIKTMVEDYKGIALYIDGPMLAAVGLQTIRKIEPNRPIIAFMEDIDSLIERHGLSQYLALLDGEAQVDNIVFIASTNHPRSLPDSMVNRPSRFDERVHVPMPSPQARGAYISHRIHDLAKEDISEEELDRWVRLSDNFSIAHLRELIVSVKCLGKDLEETATRLADMRQTVEDIHESETFGFIGKKKDS